MKRHFSTILLASAALMAGDAKLSDSIDAKLAFARLKSLAGEWEGSGEMGKSKVVYEVIAGGSAVVEHETAANMPEMMTVYHLDGDRLILTHYCMQGNQPRMQAKSFNAATGELAFKFLDATNLASPQAGHMHDVTMRFESGAKLSADWQFYENGRLKMTEKAQYTRVR
jgi:hypothetical protein